MFQIINFEVFNKDFIKILNKTTLNLFPNETYCLLGYNGVGKTTIFNSLWEKYLQNDKSVSFSGSFAYLPQHLPEALSNFNPQCPNDFFDYFELTYNWFNCENIDLPTFEDYNEKLLYWSLNSLPAKNFKKRLLQNLFDLKLSSGFLANDFSLLSPGTKKKLLLAILFATNPDFILIDELTNHLDTESIQVITDWLKDYSGTILLIDHNQEFLEKNVTNYIYIADNLNRELTFYSNKSYSEVLNLLSDKEKEDQSKLKNVEKRKLSLEKNLEHLRFRAEVFNADVGTLISNVKKKIKREVDENEIIYNLDLRKQVNFEKNGLNNKIKKNLIFSVKDLKFKIGAKKTQYIEEFKIYKGERVWIQGKNGSGKSTFLKLMQSASNQKLNNEDQFLSGVFSFGDSFDSQKIYSLEQNIKYGLDTTIDKYILLSHKLELHEINSILKNIGLYPKYKADSNLSLLSLGEYIRLQIGLLSINISKLDLIILDEPGNFIDIFTQQALIKMLNEFNGSVLMVTHDEILGSNLGFTKKFILD